MQASGSNGESVTGVESIRLFGPWRAKDTGALVDGFADLSGGDAAQTLRLVVYAFTPQQDAFAPGALVAISDPLTLPAHAPRAWVRFPFPDPFPVARDTRYGLGVWFVGPGDAQLWVEARLGGRWNIPVPDRAPTTLALSPNTRRDEGLPGLYATVRVAPLAPPAPGWTRLTPALLPAAVPVANPLSGPHRWHGQETVPGFAEAVAYDRFTWSQVEGDTPGSYDWQPIASKIAAARARGQLYAFRVRARITSYEVPAYLSGRGFNDAYFRERHAALHQALRAAFGDHPDVLWIDLDGPGNYGEWAGGDWSAISASARADVVRYLSAIWRDATVRTIVCTPQPEELAALRAGLPTLGFRNDIWGGEGAAAQLWSQQALTERMDILNSGERNLILTGELDSAINGWSVRALHAHILWFGPHSVSNGNFKAQDGEFSQFSAAEQAELRAAFTKLGYRLAVTAVDVPAVLTQNEPTTVVLYWENQNVTVPVDKDVGQAYLELVSAAGQVAGRYRLGVNVQSLAPTGVAPHVRPETLTLRGLAAGTYSLQLRVDLPTRRTMNLANAGRTATGAYPLGSVTVASESRWPFAGPIRPLTTSSLLVSYND